MTLIKPIISPTRTRLGGTWGTASAARPSIRSLARRHPSHWLSSMAEKVKDRSKKYSKSNPRSKFRKPYRARVASSSSLKRTNLPLRAGQVSTLTYQGHKAVVCSPITSCLLRGFKSYMWGRMRAPSNSRMRTCLTNRTWSLRPIL